MYLKTIGRILPKKWNKWAENILYYDKATGSNEIHTDKTTDESAQIEPEIAEKGSQSEVISKDGKVQTNKVTFHDIAMQTECIETTDKNSDQAQQIADLQSENGLLEVKIEELRSIIIRLKVDLQSKNGSLIKENGELHIANEELIKSSKKLVKLLESSRKSSAGLEECYERKLTECKAEFTNRIKELLEMVGEVRKNSLIEQLQKEQKQVEDQLKA